ncbi:hypothetical protein ACFOPX_05040 [Helicobacter baculiformis]|uniref:DUF2357 domain-containing protein n=1 Tax=Helicobacter baculiformis TaxID=427351 RepID=A0ABV7ZIM6_9HELI|nr:hypothetical protein [Helicobacter baculiformis]
MLLEELYLPENKPHLEVLSWLRQNSGFDKKIGRFEQPDLFSFLENIRGFDYAQSIYCDDFYYLLEYTSEALECLIRNPNTNIRRAHAKIPLAQAKEFDAQCVFWLGKKPGRALKDRLPDGKMLCVKRVYDPNTIENRLLKRFIKQVLRIAQIRETRLGDLCSFQTLLLKMRHWLKSEVAQNIHENQPVMPNNLLLHHHHYSKIFKAYQKIHRPLEYPRLTLKQVLRFEMLMQLHFFSQIPILPAPLSIEHFCICQYEVLRDLYWVSTPCFRQTRQMAKMMLRTHLQEKRVFTPSKTQDVFIDLFQDHPCALLDGKLEQLPLLHKQRVKGQLINANNARVLHVGGCFSLPRALKELDTPILGAFLHDFKERFYFSDMHYLVEDWVDDFEFKNMKSLIASYFHQSKSLPKSIACALSYLKHPNIKIGDTLVVFYEEGVAGGRCWLTPLVVEHAPKDQQGIKGMILVRYPTHLIDSKDRETKNVSALKASYQKYPQLFKNRSFVVNHPNAQDLLISMCEVFTLIEQGNKPYKDHLPNLSLEYFDGTYFKSFVLVDEKSLFQGNKTCIAEKFILKAKETSHYFNISVAGKPSRYQLHLETLPHVSDIVCRVELEYCYEHENVYTIHFLPTNPDYPRSYIPSIIEQKPFDPSVYPNFPDLQPLQKKLIDEVLQLDNYEHLRVPKNVKIGSYYNRQTGSYSAHVDLERLDATNPPTARWFYGDIKEGKVIPKDYCNEEMLKPGTLLRAKLRIDERRSQASVIRIYSQEDFYNRFASFLATIFAQRRPLDTSVSEEFKAMLEEWIEFIEEEFTEEEEAFFQKQYLKIIAPLGHLLSHKQREFFNPYFKRHFLCSACRTRDLRYLGFYLASTHSKPLMEHVLKLEEKHALFALQVALWHTKEAYELLEKQDCKTLLNKIENNMQTNFKALKSLRDNPSRLEKLNNIVNTTLTLLGVLRAIRLRDYDLLKPSASQTKNLIALLDEVARYCLAENLKPNCERKLDLKSLGIELQKSEIAIFYVAHLFLSNDKKIAHLTIS